MQIIMIYSSEPEPVKSLKAVMLFSCSGQLDIWYFFQPYKREMCNTESDRNKNRILFKRKKEIKKCRKASVIPERVIVQKI